MIELNLFLSVSCLFARQRLKTVLKVDKTVNVPVNRPFPSSPDLCIKTRLGAQPLIWKWFFILMQIKLISTRKVQHLTSFWYRGLGGGGELGNGLFHNCPSLPRPYPLPMAYPGDMTEVLLHTVGKLASKWLKTKCVTVFYCCWLYLPPQLN